MFEKRKEPVQAPVQTSAETLPTEVDKRPLKSDSLPRVTATIGKTICIDGNISGAENLIINGQVKGSVNLADHDLTVGEFGKVSADLVGKLVRIDGEVTGDIVGTEVVIVSQSGQVRGNIVAPRVTLEDGANFKGSIDMDPVRSDASKSSVAKPQPKQSRPEAETAAKQPSVA